MSWKKIKLNTGISGEEVRDKLEVLKNNERLDVSSVKEAPRMTVSLSAPENANIGDLWGKA